MAEPAKKQPSVFVRHLARDPATRVMRRLRPTNQLDFMLADGRRIRRKNARTTELGVKEVSENLGRLQEAVANCVLEIQDASGAVLDAAGLAAFAGGKSTPKTQVKSAPEPALEDAEVMAETEVEEDFFEDTASESAKSSKKAPSKKGKKE